MKQGALKLVFLMLIFIMTGCVAQAQRESLELEMAQKQFIQPKSNDVGLYIYRGQEGFFNSANDPSSKKQIWVNGKAIGGLINNSYFFINVVKGIIFIETESEFGNNELTFEAIGGRNYYIEQNLKMGVIIFGSELKLTYENRGKLAVLSSTLLKMQ